ncbi:hypothetical protein BH11GEM1_BH11GEM1_04920 [soil metagenome]
MGSRDALAFAAFSLQHAADANDSAVERRLEMLRRVYELGEDRQIVARALRVVHVGRPQAVGTRMLPAATARPRRFAVTVADMGDFAPDRYAADLDDWCRATRAEWNRVMEMDTQ